MINFVLCDDNISSLNRLDKMLDTIFINNNIDGNICLKASSPEDAIDYSLKNKVDVLFLDINLNSTISGCDVADIVRKQKKNVYIVFLTGHLEYALLAYKYKTFDYLPKPIVSERLEETVLRLVEDMTSESANYIHLNNNKTIINTDEINYIKKDGMKLVFCTNTRNYETYSSFSKFEKTLPENFIRCHKSYIVNINSIAGFKSNGNILELKNNQSCTLGAKYKNSFMEVFKNGNITNNMDCINK